MSAESETLAHLGLSTANATAKAALFARCDAAFAAIRSSAERRSLWVPGRVEVLGKHTDYCGGQSLTAAVERGFCARFAPRADGVVRVIDISRNEQSETPLGAHAVVRQGDWSNYVATVARRMGRDFALTRGVDVVLGSDLPPAAGLSSSSALMVTVAFALIRANALDESEQYRALVHSPQDLAAYLGAVESGAPFDNLAGDPGVGTHGGSEDHVAMICSAPGMIGHYAFAPVRKMGAIPVPEGHTFVIGESGVRANKTGGARDEYNRLSLAAAYLVSAWNAREQRSDRTLADACASMPAALNALRDIAEHGENDRFSPVLLRNRLDHFCEESARIVPAAAGALVRGDLNAFARLADQSQQFAEQLLGNQVPETVALQALAREAGAVASSAFGAGFGGSVWALVHESGSSDFVNRWSRMYRASHPARARRCTFFVSGAGPCAAQW